MDWISGIQRAIDYTEAHLTEEIDFEAVARAAASSSFHFQRMFSMLCGFTLGDYIRMRRLSLAAEELHSTAQKIIDIALKYGYDTPESFSRAFSRFHGVTPRAARSGSSVKSFSRLSVKLILDGGNLMDYRIEKTEAFKIICKRKHVTMPQGGPAVEDVSAFWAETRKDIDKICQYGKFDRLKGVLGISFSCELSNNGFPYGIGVEYNGKPVADKDLDIVEIPAHTFAVFTCKGAMPEAFTETYRKIVSEFFPQSSTYEYGNGVELEVYPSDDVQSPDYYCEIWIAVNEKK